MVQVEGRGKVPPKPVAVQIDGWEMKLLLMEAIRRDEFRKYGKRKDVWGGGLRNGTNICGLGEVSRSVLPILAGMTGEYATCKKLNAVTNRKLVSLDIAERQKGDGGIDLDVLGTNVQVKTRQRNYGSNYVRRVSEAKRMCGLNSEWFVFCEWLHGLSVDLLGWCTIDTVRSAKFKKSNMGEFHNLIIPDSNLQPMDRLFVEVKTRILEGSQVWH